MQIHYFQRYHGKENVVTNNTMLMLSRLYNYSPDKFYSMLNDLVFGTEETPEVIFSLQETGKSSVPDAIISQKSFKIVVETKLQNQFSLEQLKNHLQSFGKEDLKVLLTLDPYPMKQEIKDKFASSLAEYNRKEKHNLGTAIKHCNLTFEALVAAMEDVIDERDMEMISVLNDFHRYCFEESLILDEYKWMRAIVAGTTIQDNLDLNLYYDKASRGFTGHGYIGLYNQKTIKAIGKLTKTVTAVAKGGEIEFVVETGPSLSPDEKKRIEEAIKRSESYGYDLKNEPHRYFLVDKFFPMSFKKTSPYPIQKSKYFNLAEMLGYDKMPDTAVIASALDGKCWEDFI